MCTRILESMCITLIISFPCIHINTIHYVYVCIWFIFYVILVVFTFKICTGGTDVIKWECVLKEYIKMSGRLLLYRFITTAKFNFLGCMLHNTLTEFSIFQTQASSFTHSVFLSHRWLVGIHNFFICRWILRLPLSLILFLY